MANRILAREGVLDGFGHVSIRHPENAEHYLMSCSRGPELVRLEDIIEFTLEGEPLNQTGRALYAERAMHGAIYAARPDVQAVCHNHSPSTIPFGVTGVPLRPIMHITATMGPDVPVWDIRDEFGETNLLVRTWPQGQSLAKALGSRRVALMRGHGSVVAGPSLREVVMTSVYLEVGARLQLQAHSLSPDYVSLTPREVELCTEMALAPAYPSLDRAWEYWCSRAGYSGI
jgi:HCOMODA/2-hydroxy-3-carboxy-muconic semialdehyde decarboxylase